MLRDRRIEKRGLGDPFSNIMAQVVMGREGSGSWWYGGHVFGIYNCVGIDLFKY